jgi:hypothetical protein
MFKKPLNIPVQIGFCDDSMEYRNLELRLWVRII